MTAPRPLPAMPDVTVAARGERLAPGIWKVAAVVCIGAFMAQLDSTLVTVSLPAIRTQLHATTGAAQWIVGGYLLALALTLPLSGWLVDRFGARRLYLGCFIAFTLASLLCGAAGTIGLLIAARLLQGMAGGLMAPLTQMMMARVAGRQMARVMGYIAMPILIAPILGPVVAGAVLKYASWPWLFYLNLPVGVIGIGLAAALLPQDGPSPRRRPIDLAGLALLSPGLVALLYGLQDLSGPAGIAALLAAILLITGFIRHALARGRAALLDLHLFRIPVFATAAVTQWLSNGVFHARLFLLPLFLIGGCGLSVSQTGWMLSALGLGMLCSFPLMGMLTDRFGCRAVSAGGALLGLAGMLPLLAMAESHFAAVPAWLCLIVTGAGQGTISIPSVSAAYAAVARDDLPVATTAINIVQRLGGPIATTLMAIILSRPASLPATAPHSFAAGFLLLVAIQLLLLLSASRLPGRIAARPVAEPVAG